MVQDYQSPVRIYKKPFELVMMAYEMRFPTCKMIPIVKETEVVNEEKDEANGLHIIDRRAKLNVEAPYLLKKIMGVDDLIFRQRNTLDMKNRTLTINAWNESFSNRVVINEVCLYSVHPENSEWTCFEQKAELDIKSFFGFEGTAEKLAIKEYSNSIGRSKDIMECHIKELADQGIIDVPIWLPPTPVETTEDVSDVIPTDVPDLEEATRALTLPEKPRIEEKPRRKSSNIRNEIGEHDFAALPSCKLEQDYIQMYLGELSPIQESRLVQLKGWVSNLLKGKVPSDPILLRFLRAREFNVEKAREMLSQSLIWRKKHGVDKILSEYELPDAVKKYFPGGWHLNDVEERPLFILRLGQMDVKGIIKSVGEEGLTKLTLHICEEGLRLTEEASHRLNKPISTWCLLLDLEGLNMRHLWRPGMKALLHIIEICEANYPETLGRVLIIRAPRVFPIMWTLVSPLIDETSRGKFLLYGGNDYQGQGGLTDYISPEFIPDWLSGPLKTEIPEGGIVPKSYYMSVEEFEKDQSPGPHLLDGSIYSSTTLSKGQVHESVIHVQDKGSVLTWDFDVLHHDIVFTVFRLNAQFKVQASHAISATNLTVKHPGTTPAVGSTQTGPASSHVTSQGENTSDQLHHKSCFEKHWKENSDFFKVENSIICHDGESIQGSHVTSHSGTYVLQWKFLDSRQQGQHPHSALDVIDSITTQHHKAKIMYYYETLNSLDYRGSMTSLQSCQSGFSNLSKASRQSTSGVSSGFSSSFSEKQVQVTNLKSISNGFQTTLTTTTTTIKKDVENGGEPLKS